MTGKLQLRVEGSGVQGIEVSGLALHHLVLAQGQGFGGGDAVFACPDGIHQIPGLIVDLKLAAGDGSSGRPAVGGVVVRGGFGDLDLAGDGGVVPSNGAASAVLHPEGLDGGIGQVALGLLDLPDGVFSIVQLAVHIDVPILVGGVLAHRVALGVRNQEGHAVDALAGDRVHLVDEGGAGEPVGDLQRCGLAVLDLNVLGFGV